MRYSFPAPCSPRVNLGVHLKLAELGRAFAGLLALVALGCSSEVSLDERAEPLAANTTTANVTPSTPGIDPVASFVVLGGASLTTGTGDTLGGGDVGNTNAITSSPGLTRFGTSNKIALGHRAYSPAIIYGQHSAFGDVYTGTFPADSTTTHGALYSLSTYLTSTVKFPVAPAQIASPYSSVSNSIITIAQGTTQTLCPALASLRVVVQDNATLVLNPGTYYISSLTLGNSSHLIAQGRVRLVLGGFTTGTGASILPASGYSAKDLQISISLTAVSIGPSNSLTAIIFGSANFVVFSNTLINGVLLTTGSLQLYDNVTVNWQDGYPAGTVTFPNQCYDCSDSQAVYLDDQNPCTIDSCDASKGVVHATVSNGTSCSDGNPCNGVEQCLNQGTLCTNVAPQTIGIGNPCLDGFCSRTGRTPLVADFNNDGKADLAVFEDLGGATSDVRVAFANDSGGFNPPNVMWKSAAGGFDYSKARVVVNDFDNDGVPDVGFFHDLGTGYVELVWLVKTHSYQLVSPAVYTTSWSLSYSVAQSIKNVNTQVFTAAQGTLGALVDDGAYSKLGIWQPAETGIRSTAYTVSYQLLSIGTLASASSKIVASLPADSWNPNPQLLIVNRTTNPATFYNIYPNLNKLTNLGTNVTQTLQSATQFAVGDFDRDGNSDLLYVGTPGASPLPLAYLHGPVESTSRGCP